MSKQCCGNCDAFLLSDDPKAKPGQGWCRAKPPHLVQTMVQQMSVAGPQLAPGFQGMFTPTSVDVWCREWKPVWAKNARQPIEIEGEVNDAAKPAA